MSAQRAIDLVLSYLAAPALLGAMLIEAAAIAYLPAAALALSGWLCTLLAMVWCTASVRAAGRGSAPRLLQGFLPGFAALTAILAVSAAVAAAAVDAATGQATGSAAYLLGLLTLLAAVGEGCERHATTLGK